MLERPYKLRGDLRFFRDCGGNADAVLAALDLPMAAIDSLEPMPSDSIVHAYRALDHIGGAHLAVGCGRAVRPQYLGVLGLHLMNSATVGELLGQWSRYSPAIGYPLQSELIVGEHGWRLEFRPRYPMDDGALRWCMVSTLAGVIPSLGLLSGHQLEATGFALPFSRDECGDLSDHLGMPFEPAQNCGRIVGRLPDLDRELLPADPDLKAIAVGYCARLLDEVTTGSTFADRVRQRLFQSQVMPDLPDMAAMLGCSRRTLQRQLHAEGWTYSNLLDSFRRDKAMAAIRQGASLKQVSHMLGFSDISAFRRSFRQWTGTSPSAWRHGQQGLDRAAVPSRSGKIHRRQVHDRLSLRGEVVRAGQKTYMII